MAIPAAWADAIRRWAATEPRIEAIHLFGSRAKGSSQPDSDLDLALAISGDPDDTAHGFWICEADQMREALAPLLPVRVDLQFAEGSVIAPAVAAHGIEIYRRQP